MQQLMLAISDIFIPVSEIKTTRKFLHFSLFVNIGAVQETGNSGSAHLFESVCYAIWWKFDLTQRYLTLLSTNVFPSIPTLCRGS